MLSTAALQVPAMCMVPPGKPASWRMRQSTCSPPAWLSRWVIQLNLGSLLPFCASPTKRHGSGQEEEEEAEEEEAEEALGGALGGTPSSADCALLLVRLGPSWRGVLLSFRRLSVSAALS